MGCAFFADVGDAAIMANTVAPVFYKLLYMSLTSLSIGVVILLIRRLADKQFSPFWKYAMWGLVLAALIIPWRPPSDFTLMNTTEKVQEISFRDEYVRAQTDYDDQTRLYSMIGQEESAIPDPLGQIAEITEIKTEAETLHLKTLLFDNLIPALWLLGAVILGIFMILSALGLVRNIEKAKITTKTEQTQRYEIVLQRCKEKLGIRRSVQVVIQSYVKTPALFGLFHPRVILPEYVDALSDEHLEYVILHELSHFKRGDGLVNILLLVLQVVYWFNPLTWILFKFIREDMELANDAAVLKDMGLKERREYSLSMLEVLAEYSKPALTSRLLCMVGSEKNVRRRITMIKLENKFKKHRFFMAIAGLMVIAVTGILFLTGSAAQGDNKETEWVEEMPDRVTFLVLGVDNRPDAPDVYNADTITLVSADTDTKIISLLSIPRDTMVYRPNYGYVKINAVASTEGVETIVSVVSEITGVKIDGYMKLNFAGFKDIIDTLGGIDIDVETDMYKETGDEEDGYIDLKKGMQHLDGSKALQYARYRDYYYGDISRTAHQQKLMMAMLEELFKAETILKLPQLVPDFAKGIDTNLNPADLLKLAGMAKNFQSANTVSATLPGEFYYDEKGISYWKIDEMIAKEITTDLLNGIPQSIPVLPQNDIIGSLGESGP